MKRIICLIAVLMMCAALVCPAFAAENDFVPSITYKDGPEFDEVILEKPAEGSQETTPEGETIPMERENVANCLVITSVTDAEKKTTDIYQEDRDTLLEVYQKLSDGTMKLPLEDGFVIRELVDIGFKKTTCVETEHTHKADMEEEHTTVIAKFNLGVAKDDVVQVLHYHNGQWEPIESVVNNGDGTITCVFEHFCPVAFCVNADAEVLPPKTGDTAGTELLLWSVLLLVSVAAVVALVVCRRKTAR